MAEPAARGSRVTIHVDGRALEVTADTVLASALCNDRDAQAMRRSVTGARRAPLCGMGICYECRATVDGRPQVRTCTVLCRDGMEVRTDG